ncbi:MAG: tRNA (N(6)-L-threonylcarbamoyladenosine(37)-C(2))-methylthiotransferase MtaB, partial [Eubacterium sp.]|nr:tRNA (N(6)-L-threonylcarbamoyladenosine(37)-C(2))-methylthiotransferase MtaB [Eubacterium sp.]
MNEFLKDKKVYIYTLGCKVNQFESDAMLEALLEAGCIRFDETDKDDIPDICIINTCSVTNMADKKSRQIIHRL